MSQDYFMTTKMERWRLVNALVAYDGFYEDKTFLELCTQMIADVKNYSEKRNNMGKTIETMTKQIEVSYPLLYLISFTSNKIVNKIVLDLKKVKMLE